MYCLVDRGEIKKIWPRAPCQENTDNVKNAGSGGQLKERLAMIAGGASSTEAHTLYVFTQPANPLDRTLWEGVLKLWDMNDLVQKLECYNGTALIETIKEKAGSFELPDSADKKPQKGKIIVISETDDVSDFGSVFKCPAKVGQTVWYKNWSSEVFDIGGKDYVNVQFRHIIMGEKE